MFDEIYNNQNAPKYYPYIHNGRFLKQLSNSRSKYNNNYFYNMRTAYNISKKLRDYPHASSRIGTLDPKTGTMIRCGINKNNLTYKTNNFYNHLSNPKSKQDPNSEMNTPDPKICQTP